MAYINGNEVLFSANVTQVTGAVDVDTEMSDTSENPVENKAIKAYIDGVKEELAEVQSELTDARIDSDDNKYDSVGLLVRGLDMSVKALNDYVYQESTTMDFGMVKSTSDTDEARFYGILGGSEALSIVKANEEEIDTRSNSYCPIVPANLEYAVKSVGDGYYAKVEDFGSGSIEFIIVTELPTEGIKSTIYLIPAAEGAEDNAYDEYIYTNGAWEKIGSAAVKVDMSQYLEKTTTSASLNRVYGVMQDGTQKLFNASVNPFGNAVVLYAGGGVIRVNAPTADSHATNKAYVDAAIASVSGTSGGLEEVSRAFVEIESGTGHILPFLKIVYSNGDVKYVCRANTDIEDIDGASYITLDFTAELDSIGFQWDELDHWAGGQTSHIYSVSGTVYASGEMYDASTDDWKPVTTQIPVGVDGFNKKIHLYNYGYYSEHTGYDDGLYDNRLYYKLGGLEINFYKNPNFSAES